MTNNAFTIATLGSHSALDVCSGAKAEGFNTLVVAAAGRDKTYSQYFKTQGNYGCVDDCLVLKDFRDILQPAVQQQLNDRPVIFVPNRSFEVYLNDYDAIESSFDVPMFGNRFLLRCEERAGKITQYDLLKKAQIRMPVQFKSPTDIDRLCIVKTVQKARPIERAFFFAKSPSEYDATWNELVINGFIDETAVPLIEEYCLGVQVNLNFFYSPLTQRLELIGTDTRRQTNISGLVTLPARDQLRLPEDLLISFEEAGHIAVTILESMIEPALELGQKFVAATQELMSPGIIGPFSLQACIVPGERKKEFIVFDVSPRMPGSPGISATPYSSYYFPEPVSMGRRVAMEIKQAIKNDALAEITTASKA